MEQNKGFTRNFWLVVIGQVISLFGNAVMRFALPIHLLNVTGSPAVLGIVSGFAFLPLAVMSPIGGIIADRVNKKNIMVFLDFFTSGLTILFLILYGRVNMTGMITVLLFMLYGISGAYQPSVQASIPVLVKKENVMSANAIINMISSLSGLLGPALGGMAYSIWGIYPVICGAAVCFFMSAVMETFIQMPFKKRERTVSVLAETGRDFVQSISYITRERAEVGKLTLCCAGVNLTLSALMIIGLPVIVIQLLEFSSTEASKLYGFMEAILAVGGLIGGICAGMLGSKLKISNSWRLLAYSGGLLLPMGGVLALDCPPYISYAVLAVAGLLIMAFASIYTIQILSYMQITVPQDIVGKVIAWVIAASTCAQPIGQMLYGFLFDKLGKGAWGIFAVAAIAGILIAVCTKKIGEKL